MTSMFASLFVSIAFTEVSTCDENRGGVAWVSRYGSTTVGYVIEFYSS